jgi:hypothetical protein
MHSHEQSLKCPGCGEVFTRLGGLVSHIELTECQSISKQRFDSARIEKEQWHKNYQEARAQPAFREPAPGAPATPAKFYEDNLISFEEPSAILNSAWGVPYVEPSTPSTSATAQPQRAPAMNNTNEFPALGKTAVKVAIPPIQKKGNAWASQQNLFPNAPTAITPLVDLMASLAVSSSNPAVEDPAPNEHDPDSPGFRAGRYFVPLTGKYRCPWLGCG